MRRWLGDLWEGALGDPKLITSYKAKNIKNSLCKLTQIMSWVRSMVREWIDKKDAFIVMILESCYGSRRGFKIKIS